MSENTFSLQQPVAPTTFGKGENRLRQLINRLATVSTNPIGEMKLIAEYVLQTDFWRLYAGMATDSITPSMWELADEIVEKRVRTGRPIQYIIGYAPFFGFDFKVNPNVLIPRPETELLVELALGILPSDRPSRCLDVGTGSGCIAITLLKERPHLDCVAVDISAEALAVARENGTLHAVNDRLTLLQSDLFQHVEGCFDLIISNPPYVRSGEFPDLQSEVKFEPVLALDGGADGLSVIQRLVQEAGDYLTPDGHLIFEISPFILASVHGLLREQGWEFKTEHDLAGNPRAIVAQKSSGGKS